MRQRNEMRRDRPARPARHATRTAAGIVHARKGAGYTADEHARALDKLMEDILCLDRNETESVGNGRSVEPKLRLTDVVTTGEILGLGAKAEPKRATLRIA